MSKGIVVRYLCTNPSCVFSDSQMEQKSALNMTSSKASFKVLICCPKCKSSIEMTGFVSGTVEIIADDEEKIEKLSVDDKEDSQE